MTEPLSAPRVTAPLPASGSFAEATPERWPTLVPWGRLSQGQRSQFLLSYFPPPLETTIRQILYVGSGTAWWASGLRARYFAEASVLGVEPPGATRSPASGLLIDGSEVVGLTYPAASFDLVQMVLQLPMIPQDCLPAVLLEVRRVLKPGGFLHVIEAGWGYGPPAFSLLYEWVRRALAQEGVLLGTVYRLEDVLEAADFAPIRQTRLDLPVGSYAGEVGIRAAALAAHTLEGLLPPRLSRLGVTERGYGYVREAVQLEWAGQFTPGSVWVPPLHPYFSVVGQKPTHEAPRTTRRLVLVTTPLPKEAPRAEPAAALAADQEPVAEALLARAPSSATAEPFRSVSSPARELGAGLKAALPLALSITPFMAVFGLLMTAGHYPWLIAQAMSVLVFAGSQLVVAQLLLGGAPGLLVVATGATMNARHLLYSASIAVHLRKLALPWRLLLAYLLTDETYLLSIRRYAQPDESQYRHWFWLGAGVAVWVACQGSTALGSLVGVQVPAAWHLEFTATLTFLALLIASLRDRASRGAALVAGVCAVLVAGLPFKLGLLAATGLGLAVGLVLQARSTKQRKAVPA